MKTFLEYASVKAADGAHIDEDGNLMDLTDDSVIEKLNAFVGSIGIKEYLNPEAAVMRIVESCKQINLNAQSQFPINESFYEYQKKVVRIITSVGETHLQSLNFVLP